MDVGFCVDCLTAALNEYGIPEIFNTDQGSQFTSNKWIQLLLENDIKISMDGRGRALDNIFVERLWRSVKYEDNGGALGAIDAEAGHQFDEA